MDTHMEDQQDAGFERITEQEMQRFRRGTWVLAALDKDRLDRESQASALQGGNHDSVEKTLPDQRERGLDTEEIYEEDEDTEDSQHPRRLKQKDLLNVFTTLSARNNKVVSAISSAKSIAFSEDVMDDREGCDFEQEANLKFVVTRNNRHDDIVVQNRDSDTIFWINNTGLRLVAVKSEARGTTASSATSLAQHLGLLLRYVEQAGDAVSKSKQKMYQRVCDALGIYVLRSCVEKIATRIDYHCGALETPQDHLRHSTDYSHFIFPEKRFPGLLVFEEKVGTQQRRILERNQQNRKPFPSSFSPYTLTNQERLAISEAAERLGIPFSVQKDRDIYNVMASMLQVFISGCLAIDISIAGKQAHTVAFRNEMWKNVKDMKDHLYKGLKALSRIGYQLAIISHGRSFFSRFLADTFHDEIKEAGCAKWIRLISAPFFAATVLIQKEMIQRVKRMDVIVLETVSSSRDNTMEPLRSFFSWLDKENDLDESDQARLASWLDKQRGSKYSGAIHCETSLLLLCIVARQYPNALPPNILKIASDLNPRFLGISKLSCPICDKVVRLAEEELGIRIERSGAHKSYYACGLPDWLPRPLAEKLLMRIKEDCQPKILQQARRLVPKIEGRAKGSESPEPCDITYHNSLEFPATTEGHAEDDSGNDESDDERMDLEDWENC